LFPRGLPVSRGGKMNNELQSILTYMERERGIEREVLIQAMEFALKSASRKTPDGEATSRVEIDRATLEIKAFAERTVVEGEPSAPDQMSLPKARLLKADVQAGELVEVEITPQNFGRIAAQTAKQAILQKIREAEKDRVFEEYKNRVGDIVTGTVKQFNRGDVLIDLGRGEAILPAKERVPVEEYQVGDRVRAFVLSVQQIQAGPCVVLSRAHADFVKALFKLEVTEINDGTVEIKGIAREPGYRTKIAVSSNDQKVDPVGACVGMRGIRVKNIVRELSGEKIDIVRWSDDVRTYVGNALAPAKLAKIVIDDNVPNLVHVTADAEQLSLAIGKRGQNVRLSSKLLGWKIDITRDERDISFEEKVGMAVDRLMGLEGMSREDAQALVAGGYLTIEGILAAEPSDIADTTGLDVEKAKAIYEVAAAAQPSVEHEEQG